MMLISEKPGKKENNFVDNGYARVLIYTSAVEGGLPERAGNRRRERILKTIQRRAEATSKKELNLRNCAKQEIRKD